MLLAGERDSRWPALRKKYIQAHPRCEACNTLQEVQVHHIVPVKKDPSKELDPFNLISLCKKGCHLKIGHGGSYQFFNPGCKEDALSLLKGKGTFEEISKVAKSRRERITKK